MRFQCFLLLIGLGLIFGPAAVLGQLRVRSEKAPQQDAPRQSSTDPERAWDLKERWHQLAGDAVVWRRADIADAHQQFIFDLVAERLQCANGEITREQFLGLTPRPAAAPSEGPAPANPVVAAKSPVPANPVVAVKSKPDERRAPTPKPPAPTRPPAGNDELPPSQGADAEFRALNVKGDGLLTYDEMDDALRAERDRWDTNHDGFIDLEEFRAYYKAHARPERPGRRNTLIDLLMQQGFVVRRQRASEPKAPQPAPVQAKVDQSAELPEGYRQFDTDHDGQIGLYEWLAAGQSKEKFLEKDLNGDGFLTPDELAPPPPPPKENKENKEPPKAAVVEGEPDPGTLVGYQNEIGKRLAFRVTGAANGGVWGSEVYTTDSSLAMAAVHAGVLKIGETGTVRVRIVRPPESFNGTTAHGITTQPFGGFPGAFRILK